MEIKRGPKTKSHLVNEIIILKKGDNKLSAKDIRGQLLGLHPGSKSIPKERAIYKILERNKEKTLPNDLDNPWSLGSCLEYDISAGIVIPIQRQLLQYSRFLTIRRARWYSVLQPVLLPLIDEAYPEQESDNQWLLFQIASFYTRVEQITEINGEDYPDTQALDNAFIFNQGFSTETIIRMWESLYRQIPEKPSKVTAEKASALKAEQVLAEEMTKDEGRLLNEFIELEAAGDLEKAITLQKANPDIQPFVKKWMALGLRRDIKIGKKEGEK